MVLSRAKPEGMLVMSRQERIRLILECISTVAITAAAAAVVWIAVSNRPGVRGAPKATARSQTWEQMSGLETIANATTKNNGLAKVAIVEFSDFQCPFCGRYATETYPQLQRELVDTGHLEYVFRHFPLESIHPLAFKAAEAAECAAEQGKFWQMHDRLFSNQHALAQPDLLGHARALGLNKSKFAKCLDGAMTTKLKDDQLEGTRLGVKATPTFMIGRVTPDGKIKLTRKISGVASYATLKDAIQDLLRSRVEVTHERSTSATDRLAVASNESAPSR